MGPREHIGALRKYGDVFRGFQESPQTDREALFVRRITALDTSTLFPFLLFAYDQVGQPKDLDERLEILVDLESYLVRRMICGLTTKNYNKVFLGLLKAALQARGAVGESTRKYLLGQNSPSDRWPDDDEFRVAWRSQPIYERITRARLRMLLEAIELERRNDKDEHLPLPKGLTVEHLMPQHWQTHWPLPKKSAEAELARNEAIQSIGNLTLVTQPLNSAISNGPWQQKRDDILDHSALSLNRMFRSIDEWDEVEISARAEALFRLANSVWPRPTTSA